MLTKIHERRRKKKLCGNIVSFKPEENRLYAASSCQSSLKINSQQEQ